MVHKILLLIFAVGLLAPAGFPNGSFLTDAPAVLDQGGGSPPGYVDGKPEDTTRVQKKSRARRP